MCGHLTLKDHIKLSKSPASYISKYQPNFPKVDLKVHNAHT